MGFREYRPAIAALAGAGLIVCALGLSSAAADDKSGPVTLEAALKAFPLGESAKPVREIVTGWHQPRKIVIVMGDDTKRTQWLQAALPEVKIVGVRSGNAAKPELADADAFVFGNCGVADTEGAPKLEWVHTSGGGSDSCPANPRVADGHILITNSQKVKNTRLSEAALHLIFGLAGSLDGALDSMHHGAFRSVKGRRPMQLEDSTMLVVGLGGSGTEIARIAHAVGMHVIGTRGSRAGDKPDFVDYVGLANETSTLVTKADVVVIAAPLTPQTKNLFNADMFARMKRGAMLIDYTRPEIINKDDMIAALKSGQLGSAGINWANSAPMAKDDPIWTAPNLILTPWGATSDAAKLDALKSETLQAPGDIAGDDHDNELRWLLMRENIRRFVRGEKMYSVFDLSRGY